MDNLNEQETIYEENRPVNVGDKAVESNCVCEDPFRVGECPAHPSSPAEYPGAPTQKVLLVRASDRVEPQKKSSWIGFAFNCPGCGDGSIMHWGTNGFNYCPSCGSPMAYEWEQGKDPAPSS